MSTRLPSYLKTYRKRAGLSQDEVAFLLGTVSGAKVSRYERWERRPLLETALAYEAIFRTPARELFAGLYQKVERVTAVRARLLARKLANRKVPGRMPRKLAVLQALEVECVPHGRKRRESDPS